MVSVILAVIISLLPIVAIPEHEIIFDGKLEHSVQEHGEDRDHGEMEEKPEIIFMLIGGLMLFEVHLLNIKYTNNPTEIG